MDIFGEALLDYYFGRTEEILHLQNSYGDDEEMPVDLFFRNEEEMPELEILALSRCRGKILDIGAGAGSHALMMQQKFELHALEISEGACRVMHERGVLNVINQDIFSYQADRYDTILMLMNGIGLCGDFAGLERLLQHMKALLNAGGQIIFDSSDISYLYDGTENSSGKKQGEVSYRYLYKGLTGTWFDWLYVSAGDMKQIAEKHGFSFRLIYDDGEDQYLAALQLK